MENYKLIKDLSTGELINYVRRLSDNHFVHKELNKEYLKWLAEGNTPEPADQGE